MHRAHDAAWRRAGRKGANGTTARRSVAQLERAVSPRAVISNVRSSAGSRWLLGLIPCARMTLLGGSLRACKGDIRERVEADLSKLAGPFTPRCRQRYRKTHRRPPFGEIDRYSPPSACRPGFGDRRHRARVEFSLPFAVPTSYRALASARDCRKPQATCEDSYRVGAAGKLAIKHTPTNILRCYEKVI